MMGVPGLFPFVAKNPLFQQYVKYFLAGKRLDAYGNFDYVHIDGNAMLHPATQKGFSYGEGVRLGVDPYANLTQEQRRTKSFELFWNNILSIVQMYRPKVLNIAIDGPAPLAKQNQQRSRRFQALYSSESSGDSKKVAPAKFDSTQISPGTIFMLELTKFLQLQIRKYINGPGSRNGTQILFSSAQVPGEGEHKIMQIFREVIRKKTIARLKEINRAKRIKK